ncbi:MAG TPA: hypothetical protein VFM88_14720 [Vicinamibacteria bacterium]|nr:hypothetical protein [Vicinamibacteria bacterium]
MDFVVKAAVFGLRYAVAPDARRFLMTRQAHLFPQAVSELIVVQNWFEEIRRLTAGAN